MGNCIACNVESADECHPDTKPPSAVVALLALEHVQNHGARAVVAWLCDTHGAMLRDLPAALDALERARGGRQRASESASARGSLTR